MEHDFNRQVYLKAKSAYENSLKSGQISSCGAVSIGKFINVRSYFRLDSVRAAFTVC